MGQGAYREHVLSSDCVLKLMYDIIINCDLHAASTSLRMAEGPRAMDFAMGTTSHAEEVHLGFQVGFAPHGCQQCLWERDALLARYMSRNLKPTLLLALSPH